MEGDEEGRGTGETGALGLKEVSAIAWEWGRLESVVINANNYTGHFNFGVHQLLDL